jgi:hypothetical protein
MYAVSTNRGHATIVFRRCRALQVPTGFSQIREAIAPSKRPPRLAVQLEENVPRRTANRWIRGRATGQSAHGRQLPLAGRASGSFDPDVVRCVT